MKTFMAAALAAILVAAASATLQFPNVRVPVGAENHTILAPQSVVSGYGRVVGSNDDTFKGGIQMLVRTGDVLPRISNPALTVTIGMSLSSTGVPLLALNQGPSLTVNTTAAPIGDGSLLISNNPDAASVLEVGGRTFWVVHFENPRPSNMYVIEVTTGADGMMKAIAAEHVDFSAWGGLWTPCAGTMTPWTTHLGSEEFEPDARDYADATSLATIPVASAFRAAEMASYFGVYRGQVSDAALFSAIRANVNPYLYGWVPEVAVSASGAITATKWLTLGRFSHEGCQIVGDNRTVYCTDDGTDTGFWKFVMDRPNDLSSGTIFAAKATQTSNVTGGRNTISWIRLASANQSLLLGELRKNFTFYDIFDVSLPGSTNGSLCNSTDGFRRVRAGHAVARNECLRVKPGMEVHAAFFETRRYSSMLGATMEWRKWEGIAYAAEKGKLYTAMTRIRNGMLAEPGRYDERDDIRVAGNPCGCIYSMDLDANFNVINMNGILCGYTYFPPNAAGAATTAIRGDFCNVDGISEPDNVWYIPGQNAIIINEDTSLHYNPATWWVNLETLEMTRIAVGRAGGEWTGAHYVEHSNGYAYILNNYQRGLEADCNITCADGPGFVAYHGPFLQGDLSSKRLALEHVALPFARDAFTYASAKYTVGDYVRLSYKTIGRSGDSLPGTTFKLGEQRAFDQSPVFDYALTPSFQRGGFSLTALLNHTQPAVAAMSEDPDYTGFWEVCGTIYVAPHFESINPGSMYLLEMTQAPDTGLLTTKSAEYLDWSAWGGLWIPCGGAHSPWNTRLGSEEYEPDARRIADSTNLTVYGNTGDTFDSTNVIKFMRHYKYYANTTGLPGALQLTMDAIKTLFKPYRYGYVTELIVEDDGSYELIKHYTLGRVAVELGYVMPDQKTAYITDDGDNVGFYKFVATRPADLSEGCLYAAKMKQTDSALGGSFTVSWIRLGCSTQAALTPMVNTLGFYDIFDAAPVLPGAPVSPKTAVFGASAFCPAGFRPVSTQRVLSYELECLRVKPGMETAAAFLETRRYASYMGATTESTKWEGFIFAEDYKKAFTTLTRLRDGMVRNNSRWDRGGNDDIRLAASFAAGVANPCGCVYALDVDATYNIVNMYPEICGIPDSTYPPYTCYFDGIAEPDNIGYIPGGQLLISEDTGRHQNDFLWLYDLDTKSLTRILTTPYGAEVTSSNWFGNIGKGFSYIGANVQHPYGESDVGQLANPVATGRAGHVGYLGPIPNGMERTIDYTCKNELEDICPAGTRCKTRTFKIQGRNVQQCVCRSDGKRVTVGQGACNN